MPASSGAFNGANSNRANTAFTIGLFTILGALCFEYIGGYQPCELCLLQRWPYYIGLPLLGLTIAMWRTVPVPARIGATIVVFALFVWSIYLGTYHAGVEWGFWPGPTSCTGLGEGGNFSDLSNLNAKKVVPCDKVQWRFLGLSFAGYNALISVVIAGFLGWSVLGQIKRFRREGR